MTDSPTVSSLLTVATLADNGRSQLAVGLQLNDGQRFWANCVDVAAASRMDETAVFDPQQAIDHVQQLVQPLWQDQPVPQFRPLAQLLTTLTELFTYSHTIQPQPTPSGVSRRSLITGFLAEEEKPPEPQQERVTIERPLHPALQYGLTAALLQAVAAANRLSVAELIAKEYGLPPPDTAVPLQITLNDENIQIAHTILTSHVAALVYTTSKMNDKAALGANGERLQQHIRQVAAWLPELDATFQPCLHLDLRGSFGTLFENNGGKVLGALYGLEQAAKPYVLYVQNPVWLANREAQIEHLEQLKSYLLMRRMKLNLVADVWVDSLADVELFTSPKICHAVHIELPRLGNLDAGITAVLHVLAHNQQIILSGEDHPLTTHIGLATRPTRLSGPPQLHYNTMKQFLLAS